MLRVARRPVDVAFQLAEALCEAELLLVGQRLAAEDQHFVLDERPLDDGELFVRERLREVDIGNLGPKGGVHGPDHRHCVGARP